MRKFAALTGLSLIGVFSIGASTQVQSQQAGPAGQAIALAGCTKERLQASAPRDTTIVSVEQVSLPVAHCKVVGYVTTTNPGPNQVNFALHLPAAEKWNKRFFFANQGGSGGSIPAAAQHPSGNPLNAGFAWAGTDKGHSSAGGTGVSGNWEKDPAKVLDNAHRGAHVVTVAAQQMTKAYYGVSKMFRYTAGCSGGGGMSQAAAQKHPEDYDGIMMGGQPIGEPQDPLKQRQFEHAIMVQEALREPGSWVSPAKLSFASKKVLEVCDGNDGAVDGIIQDSRLCRFDFKQLQCTGADGPECLTQPEITSIDNMLKFSYMPISSMDNWSGYVGQVPPSEWKDGVGFKAFGYSLVKGWVATHLNQPDRDLQKQPLTRDEMWKIMVGRAAPGGVGPYGNVGWQGFEKAGGKLIFFTGEGDPCCSAIMNEQFFRDTWKLHGGQARVDRFAKLYVIPGWGHCGGSVGPADADDRLFQKLIDWVENGKEPGEVVAGRGSRDKVKFDFWGYDDRLAWVRPPVTTAGQPSARQEALRGTARDFLLCPFPLVSVFDRSKANVPGAVYDAANWSCRAKRS